MIDFYYNGLAFPRYTIDDLKIILLKNKWKISAIDFSINRKADEMLRLAGGANKLLKKQKKDLKTLV